MSDDRDRDAVLDAQRWSGEALAEWFDGLPVKSYGIGQPVAGCDIRVAGWYVDPCCHPGCRAPAGPFATRRQAVAWSKRMARAYLTSDTPLIDSVARAGGTGPYPYRDCERKRS